MTETRRERHLRVVVECEDMACGPCRRMSKNGRCELFGDYPEEVDGGHYERVPQCFASETNEPFTPSGVRGFLGVPFTNLPHIVVADAAAPALTVQEINAMMRALGANHGPLGYRNMYHPEEGAPHITIWRRLVSLGLATEWAPNRFEVSRSGVKWLRSIGHTIEIEGEA